MFFSNEWKCKKNGGRGGSFKKLFGIHNVKKYYEGKMLSLMSICTNKCRSITTKEWTKEQKIYDHKSSIHYELWDDKAIVRYRINIHIKAISNGHLHLSKFLW